MNNNQDELQKAIDDLNNNNNGAAGQMPDFGQPGVIASGGSHDAMMGAAPAMPMPEMGGMPPTDGMNLPGDGNQIQQNTQPEAMFGGAPNETIDGEKSDGENGMNQMNEMPAPEATGADGSGTDKEGVEGPATEEDLKSGDVAKVKEQALKELFPIMDKIKAAPEQKFKIYCDMIEVLGDKAVLEPAYAAAKDINDETARAEALLKIVNVIDELK